MILQKRKLFIFLLPLLILMLAIPLTAHAAAKVRTVPLSVWEAEPTDNEGWTWDEHNATLKLSGLNLKVKNAETALALTGDPCTVILEGANKIVIDGSNSSLIAIWASDVKFTGSGSLEITVKNSSGEALGIRAKNLSIDKCSIKINTTSKKNNSEGVFASDSLTLNNTKIAVTSTAKYGAIGISSESIQLTGGSINAKCVSSSGESFGIMSQDDIKLTNCQTNIAVKAKKEFAAALWGKGEIVIGGGKTVLAGQTYAAISNTGIKLNKVTGSKGEVVAYGEQGDGGKLYCFAKKGSSEKLEWKGDALVGRCTDITIK